MILTLSAPTESVAFTGNRKASHEALVVLDSGIDYLPFLASSLPCANILILNPEQDGIEQITKAIATRDSISSLHIISHGTPGQLLLGNSKLNFDSVGRYASQLTAWADKLAGKDLLLYGCQVAKGAMGYLFLQQLRQLTGANLAASENRV